MPASHEEVMDTIERLIARTLDPDALEQIVWADGERIVERERRNILALTLHELDLRLQSKGKVGAQRRAMRLLRAFLSPEQQRTLRNQKHFVVVGSLGGRYRLWPYGNAVERIERRGKVWMAEKRYCIHPFEKLPSADLALARMLLLRCDEGEFLRTANETPIEHSQWDGEWRRRLREARRQREENRR